MYVDECGDKGMSRGSSDLFILSAIVVHESQWTDFLTASSRALSAAYHSYGLNVSLELHAKAMLGRSEKEYSSITKLNRLLLLRDILRFEGSLAGMVNVINILVTKQDKPQGFDVFHCAWDALINRFEATISHGNFKLVKPGTKPAYPEHGLVIVDQTDEKELRGLIREMRCNNKVPSMNGCAHRSNLVWVIEDAMHKQSQHSIPIQLCDANAYFLRQWISPNSTIRRHGARNYFYHLEPILLKEASQNDPLGIVRL